MEGTPADATIRFDFRASTLATSLPGRGAEGWMNMSDERRVKLKTFSLRPEKYAGKGDFEGWVNQFKEYAMLGQWSDKEWAFMLFLSLTGIARMYFVRENMTYAARVEARRLRFNQEMDTSIVL